jgi:4-hydroxybenzoate polyprenyltransferase/phosphoserine phosphatase
MAFPVSLLRFPLQPEGRSREETTLADVAASKSVSYERLENRPICVDLDGTLIKTDMLAEGLVAIFSSRHRVTQILALATTNKALLKQRVAELAESAPELLPYNTELISFLKKKRQEGHRLVLATAADARIANAIADYLRLFDEVICSDGLNNLKGEKKAAALVKRFGLKGFDYVGNDRNDLPSWRAAAEIITVNASRSVVDEVRRIGLPTTTFDKRPQLMSSMLRAMRPHQWSKNLLVFVPMITAHAVTEVSAWLGAIALFLSLSATASALYIVNDAFDLSADRRHPRKRMRPLASGALAIPIGAALALILFVLGTGLAWLCGTILIVFTYAAISLAYSLVFKRFPLVDVFVLAGLYTLRVLGGGIASGHRATPWLLAFAGFTFLSLALVKRTGELLALERSYEKRGSAGRGYEVGDCAIIQMFGCASAFSSGVVLALFIGSTSVLQLYRAPEVLWLIVPVILLWHCRLWLATVRGNMHDDPIVYTLKDWVSWVVAATIFLIMFAASIGIALD